MSTLWCLFLMSVVWTVSMCEGAVLYNPPKEQSKGDKDSSGHLNLPKSDTNAKQGIRPQRNQIGISNTFEKRFAHVESRLNTIEDGLKLFSETTRLSTDYTASLATQLDVLTKMLIQQKMWLIEIKKVTHTVDESETKTFSCPEMHLDSNVPIAFTAFLDHDMDKPGAGQTIIFNQVILNEGNAYNEHTGVFTCPRKGVYDFFFSIGQRDKNGIWSKLLVNSDVVVAAGADAEHKYQDVQGSNRAIVRLDEGDVVRIVAHSGSAHLEGDVQRFTTFSGYWISP